MVGAAASGFNEAPHEENGAPRKGAPRVPTFRPSLRVRLRLGVVLLSVDLLRELVLLLVHERLVLRRQLAAVEGPHVAGLLVEGRLLAFEPRCLARRQLAARHALGDPVLLVLLALRDLAGSLALRLGVVLLPVDAFRELVLLLIDDGLVLRRQMAAVEGA